MLICEPDLDLMRSQSILIPFHSVEDGQFAMARGAAHFEEGQKNETGESVPGLHVSGHGTTSLDTWLKFQRP